MIASCNELFYIFVMFFYVLNEYLNASIRLASELVCHLSILQLIIDLTVSLLSGWIVFYLTTIYPHKKRCKVQRPILQIWLTNLYSEISSGVSKIPVSNQSTKNRVQVYYDNGMFVLTPDAIKNALYKSVWCVKVEILDSNVSIKDMMEYYMNTLRSKVQSILNIYSDVLNTDEIRYLNAILTSDIYARLHFLKPDKCKNRNDTLFASTEIQMIMFSLWKCANSLKSK